MNAIGKVTGHYNYMSKKFKYIQLEDHASEDVVKLLEHNILGTPNRSMRYQHLGVNEKISHLNLPHFANIRKKDNLIGTCCLCEREVINHKVPRIYTVDI